MTQFRQIVRAVSPYKRDWLYVAALLALSAVPLVLLRRHEWLQNAGVVLLIAGLWAAVALRWLRNAKSLHPKTWSLKYTVHSAAWVMLLIAYTILAALLPMRMYFWGGSDDFEVISESHIWSDIYDRNINRPLVTSTTYIAHLLTPDRIEGLFWVAFALQLVSAIALVKLLSRIVGGRVAITAGLIFIVNVIDPSRFLLFFNLHYQTGVLFFLVGALCLVRSFGGRSRPLLLVSCVLLGASLLVTEMGYLLCPLALLLLLHEDRRDRGALLTWAFAWLGTAGILGLRLLKHMLKGSYQQQRFSDQTAGQMVQNVWQQFRLILAPIRPVPLGDHLPYAILVSAAALGVFWLWRQRAHPKAARIRMLVAVGAGMVITLLSIVPVAYLDNTSRSQFFMAIGHATLYAGTIGLLESFFPRRLRAAALIMLTGLLVVNMAVFSMDQRESLVRQSSVRFEKSVHILNRVRKMAPHIRPSTALIFLLPEEISPLGANYHVYAISKIAFGVENACQIGHLDPLGDYASFSEEGVNMPRSIHPFSYDEIIVFELRNDTRIRMLAHIPERYLPPDFKAEGYDPLARIWAGDSKPIPYFRYTYWMDPLPDPVPDIVGPGAGILLGENWQDLEYYGAESFRWAVSGAEIFVNRWERKNITGLRIEIEPGPSLVPDAFDLHVIDEKGNITASATVDEWETVDIPLALPLNETIRFRLQTDAESVPVDFDPRGRLDFRIMHIELY